MKSTVTRKMKSIHIAKDYLIPKQLEKNWPDEGTAKYHRIRRWKKIIHNYTREAGVRNLERRIGDICRKAAREVLEQEEDRRSA